jgi:hypothetical protein
VACCQNVWSAGALFICVWENDLIAPCAPGLAALFLVHLHALYCALLKKSFGEKTLILLMPEVGVGPASRGVQDVAPGAARRPADRVHQRNCSQMLIGHPIVQDKVDDGEDAVSHPPMPSLWSAVAGEPLGKISWEGERDLKGMFF